MPDQKQLDALAERVRDASPATPTPESLDRVRSTALSRGVCPRSTARSWRIATGVAMAAMVVAVSLTVVIGKSGSAFAKADALAALYPSNGDIVHLRTTGLVYNEGEPVPTEEQREIEESWIDYSGKRARTAWIKAKTGEKTGEIITVDDMWWRVGDNFETPAPDRILQVSPARMRPGSLDAYEYLQAALPDGDVVGEVERDGDLYWDIRWRDKKDQYGLKFSARALLRKSDYRPALIEHSYPGGAQTRWEVLEWQVTSPAELDADLFDPTGLAEPGLPEIRAWYEDQLSEETSHPVYSAGAAVGKYGILEYEEAQATYVCYRLFDSPVDMLLGQDRVAAEYMDLDAGKVAVSVSTTGAIAAEDLQDSLSALKPKETAAVAVRSGTATVHALKDGSTLAVLAVPEATVVVYSAERELVLEALRGLTRMR